MKATKHAKGGGGGRGGKKVKTPNPIRARKILDKRGTTQKGKPTGADVAVPKPPDDPTDPTMKYKLQWYRKNYPAEGAAPLILDYERYLDGWIRAHWDFSQLREEDLHAAEIFEMIRLNPRMVFDITAPILKETNIPFLAGKAAARLPTEKLNFPALARRPEWLWYPWLLLPERVQTELRSPSTNAVVGMIPPYVAGQVLKDPRRYGRKVPEEYAPEPKNRFAQMYDLGVEFPEARWMESSYEIICLSIDWYNATPTIIQKQVLKILAGLKAPDELHRRMLGKEPHPRLSLDRIGMLRLLIQYSPKEARAFAQAGGRSDLSRLNLRQWYRARFFCFKRLFQLFPALDKKLIPTSLLKEYTD